MWNVPIACAVAAIILLLPGCSPSGPDKSTSGDDPAKIISGRIVDESGAGVPEVSVSVGEVIGQTDDRGVYVLKGVSVDDAELVVRAAKSGYYNAFRRVVKSESGPTNVSLMMREKKRVAQFAASQGATVNLERGARVVIPPDGLMVEESNAAYNGMVDMYAYHLNPSEEGYANMFPGDFTALDQENRIGSLYFHGIHRVEMYSPSGQKLNLRSGVKAKLHYPIPSEIASQPPVSIDIWHYDEKRLIWMQTGQAVLQGGYYVVDVDHFSTVNLDYKSESCTVIVTVVDCSGRPVAGATVSLGSGQGTTDGSGMITFINVPVFLAPGFRSDNTVRAEALMNGKLTSNTISLGPLTVGGITRVSIALNASSISGVVTDCADKPIPCLVAASWANGGYSTTYANGAFTIAVPSNQTVMIDVCGQSFFVDVPQGCVPYTLGNIKIDRATGSSCGQSDNTCTLVWSFNGRTYDASKLQYANVSNYCGSYSNTEGGLAIQGPTIPGGTPGTDGITIVAIPVTGVGSYTVERGEFTAQVRVDGGMWFSTTGTLVVSRFTAKLVEGSFIATMKSTTTNQTQMLTGRFVVPRL